MFNKIEDDIFIYQIYFENLFYKYCIFYNIEVNSLFYCLELLSGVEIKDEIINNRNKYLNDIIINLKKFSNKYIDIDDTNLNEYFDNIINIFIASDVLKINIMV